MIFQEFLKSIAIINNLSAHNLEWLFYHGMLFQSDLKWWADWGNRLTPHEGVDITFYRYSKEPSVILSLDSTTLVPVVADGLILNICDDFLGQSVVAKYPFYNNNLKSTIVVIYSHIKTQTTLKRGMEIFKGQIIGKVADTSTKKSKILPHLHISVAEILKEIPFHSLNWSLFGNPKIANCSVNFFNPILI
ncbi:MAG: hypothetical protein HQK68_05965 [Desulfamplus sp.]|nr:hypothetical protein [Desulfamplus sp.]